METRSRGESLLNNPRPYCVCPHLRRTTAPHSKRRPSHSHSRPPRPSRQIEPSFRVVAFARICESLRGFAGVCANVRQPQTTPNARAHKDLNDANDRTRKFAKMQKRESPPTGAHHPRTTKDDASLQEKPPHDDFARFAPFCAPRVRAQNRSVSCQKRSWPVQTGSAKLNGVEKSPTPSRTPPSHFANHHITNGYIQLRSRSDVISSSADTNCAAVRRSHLQRSCAARVRRQASVINLSRFVRTSSFVVMPPLLE